MPHKHRAARQQRMRRASIDLAPRQHRKRMSRREPRTHEHRSCDGAIGIEQLGQGARRKPPHRLPYATASRERRNAVRRDDRNAVHLEHHFTHPHTRTSPHPQRRALIRPRAIDRLARDPHLHFAKLAQMRRQRSAARQPIPLIEGRNRPLGRAPSATRGIVSKTRRAHHRASSSAFVRFTKLAGSSSAPPSASIAWSNNRWHQSSKSPCSAVSAFTSA